MATSLPPVSAKFVADVEGMLADLKRAERATQSTASVMDREVDKLTKGLKKKFSAADIGKDVLKGLGVGSGFAAAQQAAELISGYWQKAAESAQAVATATDSQLAATLELIRLRQTDDQQMATLLKEQARLARELETVNAPKFESRSVQTGWDRGGARRKTIQVQRELNDEERQQAQKLATELQQLAVKIEQARQKIEGQKTKDSEAKTKDIARQIAEANEWRARAQREYSAALEREADTLVKSIATPQEEHAARLRRIETLYQSGKLTVEQYTRALTESFRKFDAEEMKGVDEALKDFFEDLDKRSSTTLNGVKTKASEFDRELAAMWNNVSDRAGEAFADIVLTGEASFSRLTDIVARSVLEIVARMAIINPLLNAVFGGTSGWAALPSFFGGGKAGGGAVEPGYTYRVNENGQEFFKPNVGGTIMPVGASRGQQRAAGNSYVFNLPGGVSESVFAQFAAAVQAALGPGAIERRALWAVSDRNLRMAT